MVGQAAEASPSRSVERFYHEVWNVREEAVAREILGQGFFFRSSIGEEMVGIAPFLAYVGRIHAAFEHYTCSIEDLVESGDRAAARTRFSGGHRGSLFGAIRTGKMVTWSGAAFFTLRGRLIVELWVLGDVDALHRQLAATAGTNWMFKKSHPIEARR